jgi:hypothetical protein
VGAGLMIRTAMTTSSSLLHLIGDAHIPSFDRASALRREV